MLKNCPECELQVSDKAIACPHCGYPLMKEAKRPYQSQKRRKRLPNGFGQISEMKGVNLRNPFRAMVTVGKTEHGKPICKLLKPQAYFHTYNEAYQALVEYNKNPYELDSVITVNDLYNRWSEDYFKTISDGGSRGTIAAWRYCSTIKNMNVRDIRVRHLKNCIEEGMWDGKPASANTKLKMKSTFNLMFDYALEYELVDRNYARMFNSSDKIVKENESAKRGHMPFTEEEMQTLWKNTTIPYVDIILIQCYSGWRPQELGLLKLENIDLEKGTMTGGMKTEAGTNRTVPIHYRIRPLIEKKIKEAEDLKSEYLLNCIDATKGGIFLTYDKYNKRFCKIRELLGLHPEHRPHDPRMHFITMCKKHDVDEYAIKYMVGHAISDITEKVYTKRDPDWLQKELKKVL